MKIKREQTVTRGGMPGVLTRVIELEYDHWISQALSVSEIVSVTIEDRSGHTTKFTKESV